MFILLVLKMKIHHFIIKNLNSQKNWSYDGNLMQFNISDSNPTITTDNILLIL